MGRQIYSFGPFQLDIEEHVLSRNGRALALKPKVFDVLAVLVENSGRVMCKDELLEKVWADRFVEEGNLAVSIFEIRKALGSDNGGQHYVETVPRRGYRFAATVVQITDLDEISESGSASKLETSTAQTKSDKSKNTIAVLPFKAIGKSTNEYLGLGIADALITKLSNLKQITVRPTSSVRKYGEDHDPILAGKEQRVEWVLDGSVQLSAERIRLTVQLAHVKDEALHWAEKFDESFTDIFDVEDSISEKVAQALESRLTGEEKRLLSKRYTHDPRAYELYLKGRYFLEKRTTESCKQAIALFEHAIAIDPTYALAYTGLAHSYLIFGGYKLISRSECDARAESAILRALELDASLAAAYSSLGSLRTRQWDWAGAQKAYESALELNQNYPLALLGYGILLGLTGRITEGIEMIKKAQGIDPLSLHNYALRGSLLYLARRFDEAIYQFLETLALDDGFAVAYFGLGYAYEAVGRYSDAENAFQRSRKGLSGVPELSCSLARLDALSGRNVKAIATITELRRTVEWSNLPFYSIALVYCALGDHDAAFEALDQAFDQHDEDLFLVLTDPRIDTLRADPRFDFMLKRMSLPTTR
jgi:DNA-binding winged helix-turn-helix (wHTH) protein/tetratricopeptide (TPR) repeat protein